jgi:hypothetical protein
MNAGDLPTGNLSLSVPRYGSTVTNGCTGTLDAGSTCSVSVNLPADNTNIGSWPDTLTLKGAPGGSVTVTWSFTRVARLSLSVTGKGQVSSTPAGLKCGTSCSALFSTRMVTLNARPEPDQRFDGWTGGGCPSGVVSTCAVSLPLAATVTASFASVTSNLAFVTSEDVSTALGPVESYDARCNAAATAVGVNDSSGSAFVALLSSSTSPVTTRLGSARGWIRLDGKPFMDTLSAAFANGQIFNPLLLNETGVRAEGPDVGVITGLDQSGGVNPDRNCTDWTGVGDFVAMGTADGGPFNWAANTSGSCTVGAHHLLCLDKRRSSPVSPVVTAGKRIWVSQDVLTVGGPQSPDDVCQAARPSGVTTAAALIASTTRAASAVLTRSASYVRPDGTLVGTGDEIASGKIQSGPWQRPNGTYVGGYSIWTGSSSPDVVGTSESTCADWKDATMAAKPLRNGSAASIRTFWMGGTFACSDGSYLYCVQTAP